MIKTPVNPTNFSTMLTEIARRKDLSAKCKGIYYYLSTLPKNWKIHKVECVKHFIEGKDSLTSGFNELIKNGYLVKINECTNSVKSSFYVTNHWLMRYESRNGYKMYLKSLHWKYVKKIAYSHYGKKCYYCGSTSKIDVHHKSYSHKGYEQYFLEDLMLLCRDCHLKLHEQLKRYNHE